MPLLQQERHGIGTWKAVQIGHTLYSDAVYGKEDSKAEGSRKQKVNFWPQRVWVNEKFSVLRGNFLFSLEEVNCSYLSNWVVQSWVRVWRVLLGPNSSSFGYCLGEVFLCAQPPRIKYIGRARPWFLGLLSFITFPVTHIFARDGVLDYNTRVSRLPSPCSLTSYLCSVVTWKPSKANNIEWTGSPLLGLPLCSWVWTCNRCLLNT